MITRLTGVVDNIALCPQHMKHFLYPVVPFHELKKIYTLIYAIPSWITRWPTESKMRGKKAHAPGEDRTHDLQISLWSYWIMRLTRCLLRYRGRQPARALWHGQCLADGEIPPDTLWWMEFFFVIDCLPIIPLVSTNPFPNPIHRPVLNTSWNKCWKYDVLHAKQYFVC